MTYGELKSGAVKLIADGDVPCEDDTMTVLVEGGGMQGYASVVIEGLNAAGRGVESSCVSIDWLDFTETKQSIIDWHEQHCSAQIAASGQTSQQFSELSYERDLARHLFGGMGWGRIDEYPRSHQDGVDGYLRWYTDASGNPANFVSSIFESKLRITPPIHVSGNSATDTLQALDHIDFLGDQYAAWLSSPNVPVGAIGTPILIYSSQNQWTGDNGEPWWIAYDPSVGQRILDHAEARSVLVLHAKVVHVPGTSYRYLKVRFMNNLSLFDTNIPGISWLLQRARLNVTQMTFHTLVPLSYDCDEVGGDGTDQDSPLPPF